jgi:hypothetical protein
MNKYFVFIVLAAILVIFASPGLAAEDDRVCLYKDENFKGHEQCYRPGDEVSDLKDADISSIRVYGHARAMLYQDRDFRGHTMDFTTDIADLKRVSKTWHDHVGSLRVTTDKASDREAVYDRERSNSRNKPSSDPLREGVCVYDRPNFEGHSQCWPSGSSVSDLKSDNWNGKIQSIRVFGDARLAAYRGSNFRGDRIVIDHDVSNLSSRDIASIEVK